MNLGLGTTGVDPKGLGCRPETFLWRIPARYGGKGATDTWSRGTSAPCMWLPCKRQCCTNIQIYKYKYTNTNWIWLARVPLTHEADAQRGDVSTMHVVPLQKAALSEQSYKIIISSCRSWQSIHVEFQIKRCRFRWHVYIRSDANLFWQTFETFMPLLEVINWHG